MLEFRLFHPNVQARQRPIRRSTLLGHDADMRIYHLPSRTTEARPAHKGRR